MEKDRVRDRPLHKYQRACSVPRNTPHTRSPLRHPPERPPPALGGKKDAREQKDGTLFSLYSTILFLPILPRTHIDRRRDTMHRASLTTTTRYVSHRVWKADLAQACASYPHYSSKGTARTPTVDGCAQAHRTPPPGDSAYEMAEEQQQQQQQQTETTTVVVTERREGESDSLFAFFLAATTAGAMLGIDSHPVAGAVFGASCGVMAISLLEIPRVRRTSVVTQPASPK